MPGHCAAEACGLPGYSCAWSQGALRTWVVQQVQADQRAAPGRPQALACPVQRARACSAHHGGWQRLRPPSCMQAITAPVLLLSFVLAMIQPACRVHSHCWARQMLFSSNNLYHRGWRLRTVRRHEQVAGRGRSKGAVEGPVIAAHQPRALLQHWLAHSTMCTLKGTS
jgi:hypothetical protein